MSVTKLLETQKFQSVYNEMVCVLTSTNSTQSNFLLAAEIYIGGDTVSTIKQQANPDGYFIFDLHKHIEPYVTYDLDYTNTSVFREIPNSFKGYDVYFFEEYTGYNGLTLIEIAENGGGTAQVTTSTAHGFSGGETIRISNCDQSAYNGVYTIISIPQTTKFIITLTISLEASSGTIFEADAVMSGKTGTNNVLDWVDVPSWDYTDYAFTGTSTDTKFLTSLPTTKFEVTDDTRMWLNFYNGNVGIDYLEVKYYDGNTFLTSGSSAYSGSSDVVSVGVGPWNLNFIEQIGDIILMYNDNGTVQVTGTINTAYEALDVVTIAGTGMEDGNLTITENHTQLTPPLTFAFDEELSTSGDSSTTGTYTTGVYGVYTGATSYTIQLFDLSGGTSELYTFDVVNDCSKYEVYQFLFIDRGGSLVSTSFNMLSRKNVNLKKTSYKQNTGSFNASNNTYGYNTWDRGKTRLDTTVNERVTVNSDWVNEDISAVIDEMLASPEVYHMNEAGELFAIDILTNTYNVKTRVNDRLFNHTIDFEYSFKNPTQK